MYFIGTRANTECGESYLNNGLLGIPFDDKKVIFEWLRDQRLLSMEILHKLKPSTDCPSNWRFGWKLALENFIFNSREVA